MLAQEGNMPPLSNKGGICATTESEEDEGWVEERLNIVNRENKTGEIKNDRIIKLNIHIMSKDDGTGNFTKTGTAQDDFLNGYQFVKDLIETLNNQQNQNNQMNIPTGNNIPVWDKKFRYTLDAVYFHNDDNSFVLNKSNGSTVNNLYKENSDEVFNIYFSGVSFGGSYASNISQNSNSKYVVLSSPYLRYMRYLDNVQNNVNDHYGWVTSFAAITLAHECGHLLGLSHTVRYNWAHLVPVEDMYVIDYATEICNLTPFSSTDMSFSDGMNDTPTPLDMFNLGNDCHPACGWNRGNRKGCSNNLMDYSNSVNLSPDQLDLVHYGLYYGLNEYTVCPEVIGSENICILDYTQVGYYAERVRIASCNTPTVLKGEGNALIYYSGETVIESGFEVKDNSNFEIIYQSKCY